MPLGPFDPIPVREKVRRSHVNELRAALTGVQDAYDVAVADGFVGTRAEWLASLEGAQGDPGTVPIGSAVNAAALPTVGNTIDDVRTTDDDGHAHRWNGAAWIDIGRWKGDPGDPLAPGTLGAGEVLSSSDGVTVSAFKPGRIDARVRGVSTAASDNTTTLDSLVAEAATNGAELWLPEGAYRATLNLAANLRVNGPGTLKAPTGSALTTVLRKASGAVADNITIEGITIDGEGSYGGGKLQDLTNLTLRKVTVRNMKVTASTDEARLGFWLQNIDGLRVERCTFDGGEPLKIVNPQRMILDRNTFDSPTYNAITVWNNIADWVAQDCQITNNTILDCQRMGIELFPNVASAYMDAPIISGNTIEIADTPLASAFGVSVVACADAIVTDNAVRWLGDPDVTTPPTYGIEVDASATVTDNRIAGFFTALVFNNAWECVASGNRIRDAYEGITIWGSVSPVTRNITVTRNVITDCRDKGIYMSGSSTMPGGGHVVTDNVIRRARAWTGDAARQFNGIDLRAQKVPSIIERNRIVQAMAVPTSGFQFNGINTSGAAGSFTKTRVAYNLFVDMATVSMLREMKPGSGGATVTDIEIAGNKTVDSAGVTTDVTAWA